MQQVYTSTGLDVSGSGTTSANIELTAVTSSNKSYVLVMVQGKIAVTQTTTGGSYTSTVETQIKETGGAYGSVRIDTLTSLSNSDAETVFHNYMQTAVFHIALTAGQKANGYQIKILTTATRGGGASGDISFTLAQVSANEI